jgi:hypothetical protein
MARRYKTAAELACRQPGEPPGVRSAGYAAFRTGLKAGVRVSPLRAFALLNRELTMPYWDPGKIIAKSPKTHRHGEQVVERLAEELLKGFPAMAGFSRQCVRFMRSICLTPPTAPENLSQFEKESRTRILSLPLMESAASPPAGAREKSSSTLAAWNRITLARQNVLIAITRLTVQNQKPE